jgi:pyruvate/2-oxoglutarate dehydrogenase complex dihydrolipoamide dehydrogenase (E3) component
MIGCKFLIIGAGQSGLYLAKQIANQGQQVVLVEQDVFGGSYIHNLDIPKYWIKQESYKFQFSLEMFRSFHKTHKVLINHRQSLKKVLQAKIMATYQYFWQEYKDLPHLHIIQGKGSFHSKNIVQVKSKNALQLITFEHVLITVGKNTLIRPNFVQKDVEFLHQYNVFQLPIVPNNIAIIGFTPFNIEVAEIYANLGIKVEIFEEFGLYDSTSEIGEQALDYLQRFLNKKNIKCHFEQKVISVSNANKNSEQKIILQTEQKKYIFDSVYIYVKESFQDKNLNLDKVGINYGSNGIITDVRSRTTLQNVWAFGSCNSRVSSQNKDHQLTDFCFKVKQKNPYINLWDRAGLMTGGHGLLGNDEMYIHLNLQKPISILGVSELLAKEMFYPDIANESISKINIEGFISLIYRPSNGQLIGATIAGEMSIYRHYINLAITQKLHIRETLRYILAS